MHSKIQLTVYQGNPRKQWFTKNTLLDRVHNPKPNIQLHKTFVDTVTAFNEHFWEMNCHKQTKKLFFQNIFLTPQISRCIWPL